VRGNGSGDRDGSARPTSADEGSADLEDEYDEYDEYVVRPWWARASTLVAVVVALFVVSGAVTAWLRISDLQERVDTLEAQTVAAESARQEAILLAEDLATYDYRDLGGNFSHVTARATDRFAGQLRALTEELGPELQRTRAVATATARSAGVVRADQEKAVVAVFVDQTVTNTKSPQPRVERSRMELTLVREDGVWRLDQAGEL
jgi:Mce-associated membrane protein